MHAQSRFRVARLSLFPPMTDHGHGRWALTAQVIRGNVPHSQILLDGIVPGMSTHPTTEEILATMDESLRQNMLWT